MKKIKLISITLLAVLALTLLASCGGEKPEPKKDVTLGGVSLEQYAIVYSAEDTDYSERAALYLQSEIKARTGNELSVILDTDAPLGEYEIVVGETSREISARLDEECKGLEFSVLVEEKQIALEGEYFIIAAAAYYFVDTYIPTESGNVELEQGTTVRTPIVKEAKNFILLIGDGMGEYQTKIFDYVDNVAEYSDGESIFYGALLPYLGTSRTNSLSGVTDSAAGGTALASGYKTENRNIGQLPDETELPLLTELAISLGMSAGVMSTEGATGATPASFSAHASDRGSSTEIIRDQATFKYTLGAILECGYDHYSERGIALIEEKIETTLGQLEKTDGFFLMYEEAYIDKHCHDNELDKTALTVARFNQAIARFMEYAFYNPDTMVIITADHETGALAPNEEGKLTYSDDDHTGADVYVFAYGYGAECFDGVNMENTQIAKTIAKFMGVSDFGDDDGLAPLN